VIALTLFSILMGIWMAAGDDDVDENFDGVPDNQQAHFMQPTPYYLYPPPPQYFYVQEQPGAQPSWGQRPASTGTIPQGVEIKPRVDERGN
jgi:hypothetical protein